MVIMESPEAFVNVELAQWGGVCLSIVDKCLQ